jgi:type III restriction enzyme
LDYQRRAIAAVVGVLDGQVKNTFDNSNLFGIHANVSDLTPAQIEENKKRIIAENNVTEADAKLSPDPDICIEMETGTGKTLVYFRTIYELYQRYRLTKFIILVPSIAIKEGVLATFDTFKKPLADRYGFTPACFEYDSGKLSRVRHFIEDTQPQIMIATIQAIVGENTLINRTEHEDPAIVGTYLESLGRCQPVIVMDEPQEGMDTEGAVARLATLSPLAKLRYSATHKVVKNLLYRLTPFDAYQHGMVKKIEVLSVAEKNDEATLKIEFSNVQTNGGAKPKAKLNVWRKNGDGFKWKETNWLTDGDNIGEKSGNISYRDYTIERIWKGIGQPFRVKFTNGVELVHEQRAADFTGLFRQQLQWLIRRHFQKKPRLVALGIKPLSLIFIDRVDSYVKDDGIIKTLFHEEYAAIHREMLGSDPTPEQITATQGYYFAKTGGGEYTDSENSMLKNREIFDLILRDKETLLALDNPIEFIFSHSALGVGWDNPNIFNIATLNQSYSDIKKRQELGRGLRICRSQAGVRIYDAEDVKEGDEINLLTIIPNETYETFAAQYQEQIKEVYGTADAGGRLRKKHKGRSSANRIRRREDLFGGKAFRAFWQNLAKRTDYLVDFREDEIVRRAVEEINRIVVSAYEAQIALNRITAITRAAGLSQNYLGGDTVALKGVFSPLDLVEEWSESTGLSYAVVFRILREITNWEQMNRNPYAYTQAVVGILIRIELEEKLRGLRYSPTGELYPLAQFEALVERHIPVQPTPQRGIYDHVFCDSGSTFEQDFAAKADADPQVLCFVKLPDFYKIPTPFGDYTPDFGLVLRDNSLKNDADGELYFVIETKGTNDLEHPRALTDDERRKIRCAMKHFEAIGIRTVTPLPHQAPPQPQFTGRDAFVAPVEQYQRDFRARV